ncbi:iron uptake porin [Aerosakkonema sp. BLCC-F183]|uniref:iron uptake porin n=1 Tax=Aerosakkonema sp. BLCC-F183 TaxID=3342834 RepID=UPI0035B88761
MKNSLQLNSAIFGMPLFVGVIAVGWGSEAIASETDATAYSIKIRETQVSQVVPATVSGNTTLDRIRQYSKDSQTNRRSTGMGQITSVSQLTDVQPTDWAFQALQSLVERYGCIEGYPDRTYRGNRAMTRYEFAAGLNACLNRIQELIAAASSGGVTQEDLEKIRRLQTEFSSELGSLRGRIDTLETRTTRLEAQQFSATTKLQGTANFLLRDSFAGNNIFDASNFTAIDANSQPVLQYNARLDFVSSFTGKDRLRVRLQAANTESLNRNIDFGSLFQEPLSSDEGIFDEEGEELIVEEEEEEELDLPPEAEPLLDKIDEIAAQRDNLIEQGIDKSAPEITTLEAQIEDIETQIDKLVEQSDSSSGTQDSSSGKPRRQRNRNTVRMRLLDYRFPIGRNLRVNIFAIGGRHSTYADKITQGASNPLYNIGESGAGIGINYQLSDLFKVELGYIAGQPNSPDVEKGLFDGNYSALAQLVMEPSKKFKLGLTYVNSYTVDRKLRFGGAGSYLSNLLQGEDVETPTLSNSFGIAASYRVSRRFIVGGWASYTNVDLLASGGAEIWNYALTFSLPDLGKKGNQAVLTVGVDTTLRGLFDSDIDIPQSDNALFVNASYKYRLTDNISITPSLRWQPAIAQDFDNDDIFLGTLKTTFSF